jgi:hypothetical protein
MRLTQIHRFPERLLSTVQRGTAFEYRALALLTKHMSMSLTRVGGSYDGGVDLIGWWWVPSKKNLTTTRAWPRMFSSVQFSSGDLRVARAQERAYPPTSFQILSTLPQRLWAARSQIEADYASSHSAKPKRGRWVLRTYENSRGSCSDTPPPPAPAYYNPTRPSPGPSLHAFPEPWSPTTTQQQQQQQQQKSPHPSRSSSPNPPSRATASSRRTHHPSHSFSSIFLLFLQAPAPAPAAMVTVVVVP